MLVVQSCLTLCDPMDCSPPGFSVRGILQARTLEWVALPSSRGSSQLRDQTCVSCISCTVDKFFTTEPPGKPIQEPISNSSVKIQKKKKGYSPPVALSFSSYQPSTSFVNGFPLGVDPHVPPPYRPVCQCLWSREALYVFLPVNHMT